MASTREIINDLRAHARALDSGYLDRAIRPGVCRSLRRASDEIERLLAELTYLRGFAEEVLAAEEIVIEDAA